MPKPAYTNKTICLKLPVAMYNHVVVFKDKLGLPTLTAAVMYMIAKELQNSGYKFE